ncbi:MAG TPA: hypothetical protein VII56_02005 [Rhizomicrobium sp.]
MNSKRDSQLDLGILDSLLSNLELLLSVARASDCVRFHLPESAIHGVSLMLDGNVSEKSNERGDSGERIAYIIARHVIFAVLWAAVGLCSYV